MQCHRANQCPGRTADLVKIRIRTPAVGANIFRRVIAVLLFYTFRKITRKIIIAAVFLFTFSRPFFPSPGVILTYRTARSFRTFPHFIRRFCTAPALVPRAVFPNPGCRVAFRTPRFQSACITYRTRLRCYRGPRTLTFGTYTARTPIAPRPRACITRTCTRSLILASAFLAGIA